MTELVFALLMSAAGVVMGRCFAWIETASVAATVGYGIHIHSAQPANIRRHDPLR